MKNIVKVRNLIAFILRVASGLGLLLVGILLSNFSDENTFGLYSLCYKIIPILSIVTIFGLNELLLIETVNKKQNTLLFKLLIIINSLIITFLVLIVLYVKGKNELAILLSLIIPYVIAELGFIHFTGKEKHIFASLMKTIRPILTLVAIALVYFLNNKLYIVMIVAFNWLGCFYILRKIFKESISELKLELVNIIKNYISILRKIWPKSSYYLYSNIANILRNNLSIVILSLLGGTISVAKIAPSIEIATLASFLLISITNFLKPSIIKTFNENGLEGVKYFILNKSVYYIASGLIFFTIIFLYGSEILSIWGENYSLNYNILIIISLGTLSNIITGPVGVTLALTANQIRNFISNITGLFLQLSIMLIGILLKMDILMVTAYAIFIGLFSTNIVRIYYLSRL